MHVALVKSVCDYRSISAVALDTKAKILGQNAASFYGININQAQQTANNGDLAWARQLIHELKTNGFAGLHNPLGGARG
jgi:hypothetical protein